MLFRFFKFNYLFASKSDRELISKVESITYLKINNIYLYKMAFQYKKNETENYSNERLEFLGDAVLSSIVADFLFKKYPYEQEGYLTDIRSRIVNRQSLGMIALKLGIQNILVSSINSPFSKYAYGNALEALIAAIYLDRGYYKCNFFVLNALDRCLDLDYIIKNVLNYKSLLFEWASKNQQLITFNSLEKIESEDQFFFRTEILLNLDTFSIGEGKTKKCSEQNAAKLALEKINQKKNDISEAINKKS